MEEKRKRPAGKEEPESKDKTIGDFMEILLLKEMSLTALAKAKEGSEKAKDLSREIGYSIALHRICEFMAHSFVAKSVLCAPGDSLSQNLVRLFLTGAEKGERNFMLEAVEKAIGKDTVEKFMKKVVISPHSKNIKFHTDVASFTDSFGTTISIDKRFLILANTAEEEIAFSDKKGEFEGWIAYTK